ncbi:hypothetical protein MITSMUL_05113 [Mitsuokella multacida DSM 20544]|uniref:Uncharacterized protein n=1 Tax=Mitsuokella multacida DSM 20544 TaxID=500635 RepID=C9KPF6_9FIRM|nr:hypothetical protein MITSMUL_05113 [Mitsuokella multacida DSM 20544]
MASFPMSIISCEQGRCKMKTSSTASRSPFPVRGEGLGLVKPCQM